jgi:hypothetical protein
MKTKPLFHLLIACNFLLAALPVQIVRAAASTPAAPPDLLQFTAGGHALGFAPGGVYAATGTHALHVEFAGANPVHPQSDGSAGADGQAAPLGRLAYPGLWDGVDLAFTAGSDGIYTTTYTLSPGADPAAIRLRYNAPLSLNEDGTLSITFETGVMTESAPLAWQEIDGQQVRVDVAFRVYGQEAGFALGAYDPRFALTIDPSLTWVTFLGGSDLDTGADVAVDGSGNVYVTGSSNISWGSPVRAYTLGSDAYAAKLDSAGGLTWLSFLGGNGNDSGNGIAVDAGGNVYLTGYSTSTWGSPVRAFDSSTDVYVAKLDSSGGLTWNTFLGGGGADFGYGIAVDSTGTLVYATGASSSSWGSPVRAYTGSYDAFAARLVSSTGALGWNTFLGGSGWDDGFGIAVDGSGNVYVAGDSDETWGAPVRAYTGAADVFAAKLSPSGNLTWNTFLGGDGNDSGHKIAADGGGNVYVAGYSDADWGAPVRVYGYANDAFAAKLDSAGGLTWNTFLGGGGDDLLFGMAIDGSGNLYATGRSNITWGSPVRTFTGSYDGFAAKTDSSGNLIWNTFLGGTEYDDGGGIAADGGGNVYLSGNSTTAWGTPVRNYIGGTDGYAAKLNSSGSLTWNTFQGGCGVDQGYGVALDPSGNIYVTGTSTGGWGSPLRAYAGGDDVFAAKFTSIGSLSWVTFLGGSGSDQGVAIAVDGSGNAYVTGTSNTAWGSPVRGFLGSTDAFAAKLTTAGALTWNTFLGASAGDVGGGIAVDAGGNVFVSGTSNATWGTPVRAYSIAGDGFAAKLSSAGALMWNTFLGEFGTDLGKGIAVDGSGNVYVTGYSNVTWGSPVRDYTSGWDVYAVRLNPEGSLTWNTFLGGSGNDYSYMIAVDGSGNVYVAGESEATWGSPVRAYSGSSDAFAAKLTSAGALAWNTFLGASGYDTGSGIALDGSGNVYLSGSSVATWGSPDRAFTGSSDGFTVKVDSAGGLVGNTFLGGSGGDAANGIAVNGGGTLIYAVGNSNATWGSPVKRAYTGSTDAFVVRLDAAPPAAFGKSSPANPAYVTTSPSLTWGTSTAATYYEYCYDTSNNNTCDSSWISTGNNPAAGLSGLGNNVTYYWQVRAVNSNGITYADGGTWWSFTARHQTFADVPIDHTLWQYIEAFYAAGITTGCGVSPLIYCPESNVTRAAMAVFLLRAKYGSGYAPPPATHTFADLPVTGKEWQEAWVDQFYLEGITTGCGTGPLIYCPENPVTRAAMAVFILRALEGSSYTPPAASHYFADLPVAGKEWMEPWVDELYRRGITTGCGTGPLIFCPENPVKRQAMAAFIVRAFSLPLP